MSEIQCAAAFIESFLDDSWIFVTTTMKEDVELLEEVVMWAYKEMGFEISMSKFEQEGKMKPEGVLIGHEIDCKWSPGHPPTRGIMEIKKQRLRHVFAPMVTAKTWTKQLCLETLGLAESVRGDTDARWRLGPIYRVAYSGKNEAETVFPNERARQCVQKVLDTLDRRRSLYHRATRWVIPSAPTVEGVPNGDAAQTIGYAGVMVEGDQLLFFQGLWSDELRMRKVNIAVLEAWTIVMTAATWGHLFNCRKIVFRTDSGASCACLNKLWSGSAEMQGVCNLWEDLQHKFCFEGLVLHCDGKDNRLSDKASRCKSSDDVEAALRVELDLLGMNEITPCRVDVEWKVGELQMDITSQLLSQ